MSETIQELIDKVSDNPTKKALQALWDAQLLSVQIADKNAQVCNQDSTLLNKIKGFLISHNLFNTGTGTK